jgi:glycerophosphoryl diester phosphodiesterase
MPALIRVGHRGAPAVAGDNTLASFDAALRIGVDMIEFDVLPSRRERGALYVAHDHGALDEARSPTLRAALEHFASAPYAGIGLQIDIKRAGVERAVVEALDATGTRERAWVSTGALGVLASFRELAPEIGRGWTVEDLPLPSRAVPSLRERRRREVAALAAARLRACEITALVPHWRLVDARLVEAVTDAGGEIYVWTVDDAARIGRLAALGVSGVITNDPRLFAAIEQTDAL